MKRQAIAAFAIASLICSTAHASEAGPGQISNLIVVENGTVLFNQSGSRTTPPGCQASTTPKRWAFNGTTPAGQAMLSLLLRAYATSKTVLIFGTGTCTAWSDTENVYRIDTHE
jgi:hypothetical protein